MSDFKVDGTLLVSSMPILPILCKTAKPPKTKATIVPQNQTYMATTEATEDAADDRTTDDIDDLRAGDGAPKSIDDNHDDDAKNEMPDTFAEGENTDNDEADEKANDDPDNNTINHDTVIIEDAIDNAIDDSGNDATTDATDDDADDDADDSAENTDDDATEEPTYHTGKRPSNFFPRRHGPLNTRYFRTKVWLSGILFCSWLHLIHNWSSSMPVLVERSSPFSETSTSSIPSTLSRGILRKRSFVYGSLNTYF